MSRLKTTAVWLMIALWLSSGVIAHPHRARPVATDSASPTVCLTDEAAQDDSNAPAILPPQQVRTSGARLTGPLMDGPPFLFSRVRSLPAPEFPLQSDAPGLIPATLAHAWQFLQRAAPQPRSPSPA